MSFSVFAEGPSPFRSVFPVSMPAVAASPPPQPAPSEIIAPASVAEPTCEIIGQDPTSLIIARDAGTAKIDTTISMAAIANINDCHGPPATSSGKPKDDRFYFNFITFEVEGILFRVPRHPFEIESPVFKDMFSLPPDSSTDGSSDEHPIVLAGISANDFRNFLKALLDPTAHDPQNVLDTDARASLLHLARMWCCDKLLASAISKLEEHIPDSVSRILFANKHGIEEWLVPSYLQLVKRTDPLTAEETNKLGVKSAVKLCELRETRYRWIIDDLEEARSNAPQCYPYSSKKKRNRKRARARSPIDFTFVRKNAGVLDDELRNMIRQAFGLI